jgi:hypothetical protein
MKEVMISDGYLRVPNPHLLPPPDPAVILMFGTYTLTCRAASSS